MFILSLSGVCLFIVVRYDTTAKIDVDNNISRGISKGIALYSYKGMYLKEYF